MEVIGVMRILYLKGRETFLTYLSEVEVLEEKDKKKHLEPWKRAHRGLEKAQKEFIKN
jgi:hypothetical protein